MNEHVDELLSAYVDDELSEKEYIKVKNHLEICSRCTGIFHELQEIQEGISFLYGSIEIPDIHFENAVMAKIKEINPKASIYYRWIVGLPALFMVIIIAISLFAFSDLFYVGVTVASELIKIAVSLSHTVVLVLSSIPFLLEVFAITTIIIVGLSVWSVRYLLRSKTAE